ncbi:hypothetical protein Kpol_1050p109 [Vanderwaltozyma polyspora DSM 70294]|uniref:Transcription factor IIIA n=1 Tax=Vanderwaltozyma polyspora (strain ATCC 22028 / DSM 70294 / BCRC 21397 / CBS 2163 / NBRC 10782 / NRRL Y-8283 / UCD 57-17) TaxID=436907 RepID=A7TF03_VANPO|nr:uncharacterized protein Kpol_1050p109 [Vanderwaltozyma polyspora DSM 70294]EDO19249.1 hypothetical protein Kpol_1050p109 [Vanderwaltozyma polyspora DSM 70294]
MEELSLWKSECTPPLQRTNTGGGGGGSSGSVTSSTASRSKRFFCDYDGCDKAFSRPVLLTDHQQSVHLRIKPFKCDQCDSAFSKKSHLERHLFSHSSEKPFTCAVCNKGLTTRQQLKRHEITHTKSFVCPHDGCSESFYKHPQLRSHILAVHLQKLRCQHCSKDFQRPYRLRLHIAKHHNPDVENPYQCTFGGCSLSFKTWTALQTHTKNDHPKLKCAICDKPCVGEAGLQMHMEVHNEFLVAKNWKCSKCDPPISFVKKNELITHYLEIHKEELPPGLVESASEPTSKVAESPANEILTRAKRRKLNNASAVLNEEKLEEYLESGNSGLSLLLNTVGRRLKCKYLGCSRTFKTEERYDKHIHRHKIHELKLKIAITKEDTDKE